MIPPMTRSLSDPADRPHDETRAAALRDWNEAVARARATARARLGHSQ
jgi:hypothetical protein